jgi:hypothetical protein
MKQRMYGRKVQNWHRPLAPQQLRRRFLRHRYDAIPDDGDDGNPPDWDEHRSSEDVEQDLRDFELKQLLRGIVHQPVPLFRLEGALEAALRANDEFSITSGQAEDPAMLEQRLAVFVQSITHFPNDPTTRRRISDAIGKDVYLDVIQSAGKLAVGQDLVRNVCLFAPFWLRSPRTWNGANVSLVDHLFVRYDVPDFLYAEWSREPGFSRLKWLCWLILLAQGGSLRRAAGLFRWNIPGRFEHYLRTAHAAASPTEACAFAQIMRLGGSPIDCRRILSNPAFVVDTTESSGNDSQAVFWEATVRWIIAHRTALADEECERILSWAMHEYTEAERRGGQAYSWKGRSLPAVLRRSLDYQRQLERPWSCYSWQRHGWDWRPSDSALDGWSFVDLTSGEELFREGQAMRHCVSGYAAYCAAGRSAIVSVRFNDARRLTVEIAPATGRVVQAKGACNRPANIDEQSAIRCWLETVVRRVVVRQRPEHAVPNWSAPCLD